jgi:hypothetical protein
VRAHSTTALTNDELRVLSVDLIIMKRATFLVFP